MLAWKRDRDDLALRVVAIFNEATIQCKKKHKDMIKHTKQKFVCNYLREKVCLQNIHTNLFMSS